MHVGAVLIFEGPPPAREDFLAQIDSRLHLVPRYRQKLAFPRFEMGRPVWIDDPRFNLGYHVRHTALPAPGGVEQLRLLAGRIFSQRLDRSKPLWEVWLVQGLEDNRFALINKTHHALVDGVSGVDLATVLFDMSPVPEKRAGGRGRLDAGARADAGRADRRGRQGRDPRPRRHRVRPAEGCPRSRPARLRAAREAAEGIGEIVWAGLNPAPETPLNVPIGPHRRVWWTRSSLDDFKAIKNARRRDGQRRLAGRGVGRARALAAHAWRAHRGARAARARPVSIRPPGAEGELGNQIAAMRGPLPVYATDPLDRLEIVME